MFAGGRHELGQEVGTWLAGPEGRARRGRDVANVDDRPACPAPGGEEALDVGLGVRVVPPAGGGVAHALLHVHKDKCRLFQCAGLEFRRLKRFKSADRNQLAKGYRSLEIAQMHEYRSACPRR